MLSLPSPLVLASASPRRAQLLALLGVVFTVRCADIDEALPIRNATRLVSTLAEQKALSVARRLSSSALILAADTVVALGGDVLGKPHDAQDARHMLCRLQGNTHDVFTGLCLVDTVSQKTRSHVEKTQVRVAPMSADEIAAYVATGEPLDKAGAYGIQGKFAPFVSGICGCYYNVMGLPLHALYAILSSW